MNNDDDDNGTENAEGTKCCKKMDDVQSDDESVLSDLLLDGDLGELNEFLMKDTELQDK